MSQSKHAFGPQDPKGNENKHCQRQKTSERNTNLQSEQEAKPACWRRHADDWNWHITPFTAGFAALHSACRSPNCFAAGPPDVTDIETVVRSCSYPTVYHRVRSHEPETATCEVARAHAEAAPSTTISQFSEAIDARESIQSIGELREGDGVTWESLRSAPLVVVENDGAACVSLEGPAGGEYTLRRRYDDVLLVYPGYGHVGDLTRVVPADNRPQPETV